MKDLSNKCFNANYSKTKVWSRNFQTHFFEFSIAISTFFDHNLEKRNKNTPWFFNGLRLQIHYRLLQSPLITSAPVLPISRGNCSHPNGALHITKTEHLMTIIKFLFMCKKRLFSWASFRLLLLEKFLAASVKSSTFSLWKVTDERKCRNSDDYQIYYTK